jgi:hypothetical protein
MALALASSALLVLGLAGAPTASAGVYTVSECNTTTGTAAPDASYSQTGTFTSNNDCTAGGNGLQINNPGAGVINQIGQWQLTAPSSLSLGSITVDVRGTANNSWQPVVQGVLPGGTTFTQTATYDGIFHNVAVSGGGYSTLRIALFCNSLACPASGTAEISAKNFLINAADASEPTLSIGTNSTLLSSGTKSGSQNVQLSASDVGSGVQSIYMIVNGTTTSQAVQSCLVANGVASVFVPCPASASTSFTVNTNKSPFKTGQNAVQVCAQDLATQGEPNKTCVQRSVNVQPTCQKSTVAGATSISASFSGNGQPTIKKRSDHGAAVKAQIAGVSQSVPLCAHERIAGQSGSSATPLDTNAQGAANYKVNPGANRVVWFTYADGQRTLQTPNLQFKSKAFPDLEVSNSRLSPKEAFYVFGDLPDPKNSKRTVQVQLRRGQRHWRTVTKDRSHGDGAYRIRVKAPNRRSNYRVRVRVPQQSGYPYIAGVSQSQKLRVK